jgi:hypothetical protein
VKGSHSTHMDPRKCSRAQSPDKLCMVLAQGWGCCEGLKLLHEASSKARRWPALAKLLCFSAIPGAFLPWQFGDLEVRPFPGPVASLCFFQKGPFPCPQALLLPSSSPGELVSSPGPAPLPALETGDTPSQPLYSPAPASPSPCCQVSLLGLHTALQGSASSHRLPQVFLRAGAHVLFSGQQPVYLPPAARNRFCC